MRYHDFRLADYEVRDFGGTIVLHLVYDYPGHAHEESSIEFSGVVAYHFVHTGAAIITDLEEIALGDLLLRVGDRLTEWWHQHGAYYLWDDDREQYRTKLEENGCRAWTIASAIGFEGFVIAKAATQIQPNKSLQANRSGRRRSPGNSRLSSPGPVAEL